MQLKITEENAGLTIKQYIEKLGLSSRMVTRLKAKEKGILVNGEKKTVRHILEDGDLLTLETEDSASSKNIKPSFVPIEVIYEDDYYIAVRKDANLPIHPSRRHTDDTLASRVMAHFQGKNFVFRVLTRLDRDTSGVVICAKDPVSAARFSKLLSNREVKKEYVAFCKGIFKEKSGVIDMNIRRPDPFNIKREAIVKCEGAGENSPFGSEAITCFEVLGEGEDVSFVRFMPVTGRTHQIRVHSLAIGHPIIADTLYSDKSQYISRQALHAERITFVHPMTKELTTIFCPMPEDMLLLKGALFDEQKS
ncbi:MAG: RluA family pseudouridine synthase [Ruminococcaceae bacterium]|nr:RluA family pseudouridine synthase [Oscillospiraceae bacterium]